MDVSNLNEWQLQNHFVAIGQRIRRNEVDCGRHHYALPLAHGVRQALHCGYTHIAAVEIGVATGGGLLDLCKAAVFLQSELPVQISVWGIDNAVGLPPIEDHRDHPEIWHGGQFAMGDPAALRAQLPPFARLLIGDVADVLATFAEESHGQRLGFVAVDVDYYSSATRALPIFERDPSAYVPAVPLYVDDVEVLLTYNPWCGEAAAIAEFNDRNALRKIERKPNFGIHNFYVCHILDHPIRRGLIRPRLPFEIRGI